MACRLARAKPLPEPMLTYCQLALKNKFQWNFYRNYNIFIEENSIENVICEMAAILSRRRWVKMAFEIIATFPNGSSGAEES